MEQGSPAFYLRKTRPNNLRHGNWTKLTRWDVADIRSWVRSEGYGLEVSDQVKALQEHYPVNKQTLREVILNHTWTDLTYDRLVRLDVPCSTTKGGGSLYWVLLLILLGGLCGNAAVPARTHADMD
jgi:hypothetical protein